MALPRTSILLASLWLCLPAQAQEGPAASTAAPALQELSTATLLGQTVFISVDSANAANRREDIENGRVGGVLLQWGDYSLPQTKILVDQLQSWAAKSPSKIPLLIAADYEGGTVFTPATLGLPNLPSNMMMGAAADEKNCAVLFYLAGMELRKTGIHISFAPVLDVNTSAKNPAIGVRSFGSDPHLVGKMGVAVISGLQAAGVAAVAKHFPGHGAAQADSHFELPVITLSPAELSAGHIQPFHDAINAGVDGIMTAHVLYKQVDPANPATFSPVILQQLLRKNLGYKGVIFSDSLDMKGASNVAGSVEKGAVRALQAGADILLIGGADPAKVVNALNEAEKPDFTRLREAGEKILELKKKLGLFSVSDDPPLEVDMAYQSTARAIAEKSVTLAWDKSGIVPLPKPAPGSKKRLCGIFFCPPRFSYELLEINKPLLEAGWEMTHYNAALVPGAKDMVRAAACAKDADAVLIGTFQWADKPSVPQQKAVQELLKLKKPSVIISMMSPYDILLYRNAPAALATYGANKFSMRAVGEILSGALPPSGELPFSLEDPQAASGGVR